jgi:hypothetical protein
LKRQSLPVFDEGENPLHVPRLFRKMKVGQIEQWSTQIKHPDGGWVPGRLIALKRSAEATPWHGTAWNSMLARSKRK